MISLRRYSPEAYPKYNNYDAIEVSKAAKIPYDYDEAMGVPITFLNKHNPEQFETVVRIPNSRASSADSMSEATENMRGSLFGVG